MSALDPLITQECSTIGKIVFVLISCVEDDRIVSEDMLHSSFDRVTWHPLQTDLLCVNGRDIMIKDVYDEDTLWKSLETYCNGHSINISEKTKTEFGKCLAELQSKAVASLRLPNKDGSAQGVLDAIVQQLQKQREAYCVALGKCKSDPSSDLSAFNEILRIAYNFANEATDFLGLIVAICDLKPLVLWGTIGEHYALSEAFHTLPWTRSDQKQSLKEYIETIGDARNSAFHHLFPFQKLLVFALPPTAIQQAELRIFAEYRAKKRDNGLTYQDQELVNALVEFTHARSRHIPASFWQKNLDVIDNTIALFEATNRVLKCLYAKVS